MPNPFQPSDASTVNIDVSGTSQVVALTAADQQLVTNDGTATVWLKFGDSTVTATTTAGIPWPAGQAASVSPRRGVTHVAAIAAGATGKVYFSPGIGN